VTRAAAGMPVELSFTESGSGRPLVVLHGLFGWKRNWATIARSLAADRRVLCADLRNHGESPWDPRHDYPALAEDVAALIRTHAGGSADVLGHSMGGKTAMTLALAAPELVARLVVVDIPPAPSGGTVIEHLRALRSLPLAAFSRRSDVEAALAPAVPDAAVRAFLVHNVKSGPGGLSWAVNLEALERHAADIVGFPDPPPGRPFGGPTLFVAGGRSGYLRPEHAAPIGRLFPAAEFEVVADAGHWVHADAPGPLLAAVSRFLSK